MRQYSGSACRHEEGYGQLSEPTPQFLDVHIEPGGHHIRVPPGENVLAAALAAGIALPYSCRAGRCASCKAKLLSGRIEYPDGTPPGITAQEIEQGEVLLCQARPRSDLSIESRRLPVRAANAASVEIELLELLPSGALRVQLRFLEGVIGARPGQFVDLRNHAGDAERVAVIAVCAEGLDIEMPDDGSVLRQWLERDAVAGARLRLAGPFDRPR